MTYDAFDYFRVRLAINDSILKDYNNKSQLNNNLVRKSLNKKGSMKHLNSNINE